jgi:hypothetical protein
MAQENKEGLKLNSTYRLLAHADEVNFMGDNTNATKNNTEALLYTSKEVGLGVN